jgi:hypothetical protein
MNWTMMVLPLLLLAASIPPVASFQYTSNQRTTRLELHHPTATPPEERCDPCHEPDADDVTFNRAEAAFAMLGTLWVTGAIPTALVFPEALANGVEPTILSFNPIDPRSSVPAVFG